jgi:uncharacterized protein with FMN-binding domain
MISRSFLTSRPARGAAVVGSGIVVLAALAGCSSTTGSSASSSTGGGSGSGSSSSSSSSSSDSSASDANASFKDGTYTATGDYDSPGGASAVEVTITLKSGTVSDVKVVPKAENPTAQQYESQFSSGIAGKIVGKKITELNVTTVSGSSLTSQGFDKAISDIESQAKA